MLSIWCLGSRHRFCWKQEIAGLKKRGEKTIIVPKNPLWNPMIKTSKPATDTGIQNNFIFDIFTVFLWTAFVKKIWLIVLWNLHIYFVYEYFMRFQKFIVFHFCVLILDGFLWFLFGFHAVLDSSWINALLCNYKQAPIKIGELDAKSGMFSHEIEKKISTLQWQWHMTYDVLLKHRMQVEIRIPCGHVFFT